MERKSRTHISRRTFMKGAAAGAALLGQGAPFIIRRASAA
ncbi:MAG: hypothetical protein H6Q86_5438, partial [candidate division NC10 bacterium]|nr:hypothetical protein [candidate division NC10 bacterium]